MFCSLNALEEILLLYYGLVCWGLRGVALQEVCFDGCFVYWLVLEKCIASFPI